MTAARLITCNLALIAVVACSDAPDEVSSDSNVVNVYNWVDYIGLDTIERFEAETGIDVNYDVYDSSEIVDVKLLSGNSGYDVVVHSNQFASRLTPIGVFEKLDMSRFSNLRNLDPDLTAAIDVYDKVRGYNIPYHWGTTGFAYNVDLVRERLPDHPLDSLDLLFDPNVVSKLADCGVSLLDGATDLFPAVLAYLGRDPNAIDEESIAAAEAQVALVRSYIRYFSNQKMISDLPNREVCIAQSWSGDYAQAQTRAAEAGIEINLQYAVPREGGRLWVDGMYIPADAPHRDNAYRFIDFILRAEIAGEIVNEVYYANANGASWEYIHPEILNNPAIFPDEGAWQKSFPVTPLDPKSERIRTRAYARIKSGL